MPITAINTSKITEYIFIEIAHRKLCKLYAI